MSLRDPTPDPTGSVRGSAYGDGETTPRRPLRVRVPGTTLRRQPAALVASATDPAPCVGLGRIRPGLDPDRRAGRRWRRAPLRRLRAAARCAGGPGPAALDRRADASRRGGCCGHRSGRRHQWYGARRDLASGVRPDRGAVDSDHRAVPGADHGPVGGADRPVDTLAEQTHHDNQHTDHDAGSPEGSRAPPWPPSTSSGSRGGPRSLATTGAPTAPAGARSTDVPPARSSCDATWTR